MRPRFVTWIVAAGIWAAVTAGRPLAVFGYEEITVTSKGVVAGKVFLKAPPPPSRIFHLIFSPNLDFCGRISDGKGNRLLKEFRVAEDGGFQDVVVAVVGVEKGKKFDYTPELTVENCRIAPFVAPVRNNHRITLINKDTIAHDIQGYTLKDDYTFAMFNKPLTPETIAAKEVHLRKGHYIFRTQCGVHDYMQSWGMAVGNPYFAVTGQDGSFTIPDLPSGRYDVIAWHPHMKPQAQQITVAENGKVELNFEFDAAEVDIPVHDLQTKYRLETALQPRHLFPPTVELQSP
ncbi:MAG TPA: carboxypeptidase-like regulatory domain-containing protein [Candidatus Manganitrophaceae bacterium]|nr:carboxypeptidase-like regulatory domain-containing protein [Candidatus Manganitrophaceae bacterium]